MEDQVPVHRVAKRYGHIYKWKQLSRTRRFILFFGLLLILFSVALVISNALGTIQGAWIGNISTIFSALGVVATTLPWVFPIDSTKPLKDAGRNPSIDPDLTVPCESSVREIYGKLIDPNISAIVLRGLNGVGVSTLANLVFRYAEEQRKDGVGPFIDKALWFYVGARTTVADLAEELSMNLSKALPDLSQIAPEHQAGQLFEHLKSLTTKRLIVLDFKNPLEQSAETLAEHPDFKEFIRMLNRHYCHCTILFTSRLWPSETRDHMPLNYIQEHYVRG
ncbi:MAG: NB-ARC domain-containing protein, partial [Ktedonobacteraceae bacterium]